MHDYCMHTMWQPASRPQIRPALPRPRRSHCRRRPGRPPEGRRSAAAAARSRRCSWASPSPPSRAATPKPSGAGWFAARSAAAPSCSPPAFARSALQAAGLIDLGTNALLPQAHAGELAAALAGPRRAHRRPISSSTTSRTRVGWSIAPRAPRFCAGATCRQTPPTPSSPPARNMRWRWRWRRSPRRATPCSANRSPTPACGRSRITCTSDCRAWRWTTKGSSPTRSRTPRSSPAAACSTACRRSRTRPAA